MSGPNFAVLVALLIQLALGLAVFQANWRRRSNQCFLLLSLAAAAWLISLYDAFSALDEATAERGIRGASSAAILILTSLNLLRLAIRERRKDWPNILRHARVWIIFALAAVLFCQTGWFLRDVEIIAPIGLSAPKPVYGPAGLLYAIYFALAIAYLVVSAFRDLRRTTAGDHAELSIVLVGCIVAIVLPLILNFVLIYFVDPSVLLWTAPFRAVLFCAAAGYAIATRKVMDVGVLLRRAIAYTVLTGYLLVVYGIVWWLVATAERAVLERQIPALPHILAALTIAFAMAPARGISQTLANRLFLGARGLDFRATVNKATTILRSVTTLEDLLARFARTIGEAIGTDRVVILLASRHAFVQAYPRQEATMGRLVHLKKDSAIVRSFQANPEPLVLDELHRIRATPELDDVKEELHQLGIEVAMPIFARDHIEGVMLLGPRFSGRIYGSVEQNALQVLCGQLAVAVENAQLFTEVQNAKIYNETLLQNLTTGVIAADADGSITVFNKEAEQITDLPWQDVVDHSIDDLPAPLANAMRLTLSSG